MTAITATEARASLYRLIDEAASSHQPLLISGKRNKAVLISEEDWEAIQEMLFLLPVPGCVNPSGRAWLHLLKSVASAWTGELAADIYTASAKGREEFGV